MNANKFNKDYHYGKVKEELVLPLIRKEFDATLTCSSNTYAICDYVGDNCNVELKSRRCSLHSYPDTMISKSKIDYLLKENKKGYCVFSFYDGVVWLEITPETVATFRMSVGGRRDRGKVESNDYCYIPTSALKRFENTPLGANNPATTKKKFPLQGLSPLLREVIASA